jgi:hypothetical protein
MSEAEVMIVRRVAVLEVELNQMERRFAEAGSANTPDLDAYQRASNTQRRLLESIGIKRTPRDVTPDLKSYLASKANETKDVVV